MPDPKLLIPPISAQALPEIIADNTIVIVHAWAEWNPYDYQLDKWLHSFQSEFPNEKFFSLDTDSEAEWDFLRQHHVMTLPTLLCFINGVWHETCVGLRSEAELGSRLRAWSVAQSA